MSSRWEATSGVVSRISVVGASKSPKSGSKHEIQRPSFLDKLAQNARKAFSPSQQLIDGHGIFANGQAWGRIRAPACGSLSKGPRVKGSLAVGAWTETTPIGQSHGEDATKE